MACPHGGTAMAALTAMAPAGSAWRWLGSGCPFSPQPCASGASVGTLETHAPSSIFAIREVPEPSDSTQSLGLPTEAFKCFHPPVEPNHTQETLARAAAFRRNRRHHPPVAPSVRLSLLSPVIMPAGSISCLGPPFRALPATRFLWR